MKKKEKISYVPQLNSVFDETIFYSLAARVLYIYSRIANYIGFIDHIDIPISQRWASAR